MTTQVLNYFNNKPKVSVIMNGFNCEKHLRDAIDSVYAQTYKDWEIVFWDNASTDNSAEIAKGYDDRLRYFRSEETVPLGKARNWAIEKVKGEYIAFLDCDDIWLPDKLKEQVNLFENFSDIDFVYSNYFRLFSEKNRKYIGLKGKQPEGLVFKKFLYHYPVNMQTVMIRRIVLNRLAVFFDEKLNLSEEYDLFMRILYTAKAAYVDKPLAIYRIHSNMESIRLIYKYPEEVAYVVEKFKQIYPNFEREYAKEIEYNKAKISYWKARAEMHKANSKKARAFLSPHKKLNAKFFLLYLVTYLPSSFWHLLHTWKMKRIL